MTQQITDLQELVEQRPGIYEAQSPQGERFQFISTGEIVVLARQQSGSQTQRRRSGQQSQQSWQVNKLNDLPQQYAS